MEQLITLCSAAAQSAKIQRMQQSELLQLEQVITSVPSACPVCKDSDDAAAIIVMVLAWAWLHFLDAISEDVCLATPKHLSYWQGKIRTRLIFSASGKSKLFRHWVVVLVFFMLLWINILNKSNSERETVHLTYNFRIQPVTKGCQGRNLKTSLLAVPYSITTHGGPHFTAKDMTGTVEDAACCLPRCVCPAICPMPFRTMCLQKGSAQSQLIPCCSDMTFGQPNPGIPHLRFLFQVILNHVRLTS